MTSPAQKLMKLRNFFFHGYSRRRYNDDDGIFGGFFGFFFYSTPRRRKIHIWWTCASVVLRGKLLFFSSPRGSLPLTRVKSVFFFLFSWAACLRVSHRLCVHYSRVVPSFDDFFTPDFFFLCAQNPVVFVLFFFISREKRKKRSGINLSHPLSLSAVISSRNFPLDNRKRRENFTKKKRKMREIKLSRRPQASPQVIAPP